MVKRSREASGAADALVFNEEAQRDGTRPVGALAKRKQKRQGVEIQFDPQAHKYIPFLGAPLCAALRSNRKQRAVIL